MDRFVCDDTAAQHSTRSRSKKSAFCHIMGADVETQYSRSTAAALDTMLKACLVGDSGRSTFSVAAGIFGTAVDEASPPQALLPLVAAGALSLAGASDDPDLRFDEQSAVNLAAKSGFTAAELTVSRVFYSRAFRALLLSATAFQADAACFCDPGHEKRPYGALAWSQPSG